MKLGFGGENEKEGGVSIDGKRKIARLSEEYGNKDSFFFFFRGFEDIDGKIDWHFASILYIHRETRSVLDRGFYAAIYSWVASGSVSLIPFRRVKITCSSFFSSNARQHCFFHVLPRLLVGRRR